MFKIRQYQVAVFANQSGYYSLSTPNLYNELEFVFQLVEGRPLYTNGTEKKKIFLSPMDILFTYNFSYVVFDTPRCGIR